MHPLRQHFYCGLFIYISFGHSFISETFLEVDLQLMYYNGIEKFTKITVLTLSKLCELANYNITARRLQYSVNIELHFLKYCSAVTQPQYCAF